MGIIAVVYTAVVKSRHLQIQWLILISAPALIPIAYHAVGGYDAIKTTLDPKYLSLTNVHWYQN
jgi:SSS family solute:Na+ symporter